MVGWGSISAYALLTTYQAYYLIARMRSAESDVPRQIFVATLIQSAVLVVASLVGDRLSDMTGRRKVFVAAAATVYGQGPRCVQHRQRAALFAVAGTCALLGGLAVVPVKGVR